MATATPSTTGAGSPVSNSTAPSATTPAPTTTAAAKFRPRFLQDPASFVFNVNLFIFAIIAIAFAIRVPHLIGLFGTSTEWFNGHFFRYVSGGTKKRTESQRKKKKETRARAMQRNDSTKTVVGPDPFADPKEKYEGPFDYPPSRQHSQQQRPRHRRDYTSEKIGGDVEPPARFPPRIPTVPAFLRGLLVLSRSRGVISGYSLGQLAVLFVYFWVMAFAFIYWSNPFVDAERPGWIAVSQFPVVLALAGKGNVVGVLLGYGYERINYIHRFGGRVVVLGCNLHGIYYLYSWTATGTFTANIARPKNAWGMTLLVAVNILWVFSTSEWRKKAYSVFIWSHTIAVLVAIPAIYMHRPTLGLYALASGAIYVLDRLIRLAKTRITTAVLIPHRNSNDMITIQVPSINAGWRAGQHVRLRVLEGQDTPMGMFGWTETHPFTIASAGYSSSTGVPGEEGGLTLVVKKSGGWTGNLVKLAMGRREQLRQRLQLLQMQGGRNQHQDPLYDVEAEDPEALGVRVRVCIEGPYGGPGRMVFASFSSALLVCGGSGISYGLSILRDLAGKEKAGESRLKYIELVWVIADGTTADALLPDLLDIVESYDDHSGGRRSRREKAQIKVGIWFTRALTAKLGVLEGEWTDVGVDDAYRPVAIHPNLVLSPGRPKIGRSLDTALTRAVGLDGSEGGGERGIKGVSVSVCGPTELADEVVGHVGRVDARRRDQVGGIEVHEEAFGI